MVRDLIDGFQYSFSHQGISFLLISLSVTALFIRPYIDLLPGVSAQIFDLGAEGLSILLAATGLGAMLGAIWLAQRGRICWWDHCVFHRTRPLSDCHSFDSPSSERAVRCLPTDQRTGWDALLTRRVAYLPRRAVASSTYYHRYRPLRIVRARTQVHAR